MAIKKQRYRPDMDGSFRQAYERNRKTVLAQAEVCAICGMPINKRLKFPDPMSATVDHIIPIARGGHPSDIDNLQLAHWCCNRAKSDDVIPNEQKDKKNMGMKPKVVTNRNLPLSMDWTKYGGHTSLEGAGL